MDSLKCFNILISLARLLVTGRLLRGHISLWPLLWHDFLLHHVIEREINLISRWLSHINQINGVGLRITKWCYLVYLSTKTWDVRHVLLHQWAILHRRRSGVKLNTIQCCQCVTCTSTCDEFDWNQGVTKSLKQCVAHDHALLPSGIGAGKQSSWWLICSQLRLITSQNSMTKSWTYSVLRPNICLRGKQRINNKNAMEEGQCFLLQKYLYQLEGWIIVS